MAFGTGILGSVLSRLGSFVLARVPGSSVTPPPAPSPVEADIFSSDPGAQAGRITPSVLSADDGSFVFCLGHDEPGYADWIVANSEDTISQTATFPTISLATAAQLTFSIRGRSPTATPVGYSWIAELRIDDVVVGARTLPASGLIEWTSWQLDLTQFSAGLRKLTFALRFNGPAIAPGPGVLPVLQAEIPALYLDQLVFHAAPGAPIIANLIPESDQGLGNGAAPSDSTTIDFDMMGFGASINASTLGVTINGSPVVTAGVASGGWGLSLTTTAYGAHAHLTPPAPFVSSERVYVVASIAGPSTTTSWSFRVADTVPPTIASVQALGTKRLRVTYDEAVALVNPAGAHDGMNVGLYALAAVHDDVTPAVDPNIVSIEIVDAGASQIDLLTDIELTPGVGYRLTETGVEDLAGNHTTSSAAFTSFAPDVPEGRTLDLYRLLPLMNRQEDVTRDLLRFVRCLQEPTDLLLADIDAWSLILSIDTAPEPFLDAMLADLGNPLPFVLSEIDKRRLLKVLVAIYKQKGTAVGIVNAVRFFMGLTITITTFTNVGFCVLGESRLGIDWVLAPSSSFARYSFRIVSGIALTDEQIARIRVIANFMKPAHTHLIEVVVPTTPPPYDPVELGRSRLGVDWLLH